MKPVKAAKFGHSVTILKGEHNFISKNVKKYESYKMAWDTSAHLLIIEANFRGEKEQVVVPAANVAQLVFEESKVERNSESDTSGAVPTKAGSARTKKAS